MLIKTTQVSADDALRAVADGKQVQMVWQVNDNLYLQNLTVVVHDAMEDGIAFLVMEITDPCKNIADNCESAAEEIHPEPEENVLETIVTDPDTTPITVEIPNSHKDEKERQRKLDDERIIALRKSGLSEFKIAEAMDSSQNTIHYHIAKLKKEGRL